MRLTILLAALPVLACTATVTVTPSPHGDAGPVPQGDAGSTRVGPLTLQAFGGASGAVAAQVPLNEPGVGIEQTCDGPVDAGACQLTSCKLGGIGSPSPGYGNLGTITASVGTTTVAIPYDRDGYTTVYFPSSVTLGAGGTMTFHGGDGVTLPKFDVSATIPAVAVVTSPVPTTDGGAATIDTSHDLSVTWPAISIGQVAFALNAGGISSPSRVATTISCTFGGAAGTGVVPQALLSSLKQLSAGSSTYLSVSSELTATTVVDGLTIVIESYQSAPATEDNFNVTLE